MATKQKKEEKPRMTTVSLYVTETLQIRFIEYAKKERRPVSTALAILIEKALDELQEKQQ
jgi:hypothetical protein